jgi:hypothetical protein
MAMKTLRALMVAWLLSVVTTAGVDASGHGPVFGGATPTLGKGGWEFDQAWMGRSTADRRDDNLRSMITFGITERLQVSGSLPEPINTGDTVPMGRMTALMSDMPSAEATLGWRLQTRPVGHGARVETTVYVGGSVPLVSDRGGIRSSPTRNVAIASGYASRIHYFWVGGGVEQRMIAGGDRWGNVGYYSVVYGYRPPALRLDYPKPDLRFFVEATGEENGHAVRAGTIDPGTGGRILLVGPTSLLLYKQYGLEGGILLPVYQRQNGVQPRERYRLTINVSYFFWR